MLPVPGQPSVSYINFPVSPFFRRPFFIVIFPVIGCDQSRQSTPGPYLLRFNCFLQRIEIIKDHNHIAFIIPVFFISLLYLRFSLSYYPGFSNGRSPFVISEDGCFVAFHGSGMHIYCAFHENMIQIRGDFCKGTLSISPRIVTMSGSRAVNSNRKITLSLLRWTVTLYFCLKSFIMNRIEGKAENRRRASRSGCIVEETCQ